MRLFNIYFGFCIIVFSGRSFCFILSASSLRSTLSLPLASFATHLHGARSPHFVANSDALCSSSARSLRVTPLFCSPTFNGSRETQCYTFNELLTFNHQAAELNIDALVAEVDIEFDPIAEHPATPPLEFSD